MFTAPTAGQGNQLNRAMRPVVLPGHGRYKVTCTVAGKQVFAAEFEPAISANPYIQFKFKATESGPVVLTWTDDDGSTIVGEEKITVT